MEQELYQKNNNLFQSSDWLDFQKEYGREAVNFGDGRGIILNLPFGRKFVWVEKGPMDISNLKPQISKLPRGTVFVRIEPGKLTENEIKKSGLKRVTKNSLLSGQVSPKATRVLNISGSEEDILARMKQKTRYNIRLSAKKGVTVTPTDSIDIFYDLLTKTAGRDKGYAPHNKEYYQKMMTTLGQSGTVKIFIAKYRNEPLAGILVSFFGEVATYLHGGFDDANRNLMAPYLCQWEAIKYARSKGCKYYDFWGVAETDNPNDSWAGISRFKEGFGGEKIIYLGGYDIVINKFWYTLLSILAKIKHILK